MNGAPLLDYLESVQRRDAGMAVAQSHNPDWYNCALIEICELRRQHALTPDFTFEDIVRDISPRIGSPKSKGLPGSVCMRAVRMNLIEPTGEYRRATGLLKNAHRNCVYRWTA